MALSKFPTSPLEPISNCQSTPKLIDPDTISAFTEVARGRNQDILQPHFGNYREFSRVAIKRLQENIDTFDHVSVELLAHALRSTSMQVGAYSLSLLFGKIEEDARQKCLDQLDGKTMDQMMALHAAVNRALTKIASDPENWLRGAG